MRALKVILQGAILFGFCAVGFPASAEDKPFVGKLETESKPDEKPAASRSVKPQEPPSADELEAKRLLEKITYIGNQKLTDEYVEMLTEIIGLKPGNAFSIESNESAVRDLLLMYHMRGHAFAKVQLEKGSSPDDREVVIKIDEGPRVVVTKVGFSGNKMLPEWVLRLHAKRLTPTS